MMINSHNNKSDFSEKMQRCHDYIQALEEERQKVQAFQRELPLCLELVTQAIETCKHQLSGTTTEHNLYGQLSECSEQTTSPIFEEFIPIKRDLSHCDDDEEQESKKAKNETGVRDKDEEINGDYEKNSKKSDWLRSVQLWNQTPDPPSKEKNGSGGAFHPFKKEKIVGGGDTATAPVNGPAPPTSTSSTAETGDGGNKKEEKEGQSQRKARRCWSPELHTRFLQALQQLGGSHVATPKQIRELMKVDGLTNDEVKSHLQKYRLHTKRPSPSIHNNNNDTQTPQFVVVGGIWVPPEYATMATTAKSETVPVDAASKGIYAPVASLPPPFQETSSSPKQRQNNPSSRSDDRGDNQLYSPATSSSTHKTNVSPTC